MGGLAMEYEWYNPKAPKCRNCMYWTGAPYDHHGECLDVTTKIKTRLREHNAKACSHFVKRKECDVVSGD